MRKGNCIRVTILSVLCLVSSLAVPSNDSSSSLGSRIPRAAAVTNLGAVANDLHILARVTNAIFLQSAALRKSINVRDVIIETLGVGPEFFSRMLEFDVHPTISFLEDIHKRSRDALTKYSPTTNFERLDDIDRYLEDGMISFYGSADPDYVFGSWKNATTEEALNEKVFACDKDPLSTLANYLMMIQMETNSEALAFIFEGLKDALPELIDCVRNLPLFPSKYDLFFGEIVQLTQFSKFHNFVANWTNKYESMSKFSMEIARLEDDFERLDEYWKGMNRSGKEGDQKMAISRVLSVRERMEVDTVRARKFTLGFESAQEMAQIVDDVRSEWFKKQIAKGKNTEELAEALEPFRKFGEKMKQLGKEFAKLNSYRFHFNFELLSFFERCMSAVKSLESYPELNEVKEILLEIGQSKDECWYEVKPTVTSKKFKRPGSVLLGAHEIERKLDELERYVNTTVRTTDIGELVEALAKFNKTLYRYPYIDKSNVRQLMREVYVKGHETVELAFQKLDRINSLQNSMADAIKRLNKQLATKFKTSDFDIGNEVMNAGIADFLECLNEFNFFPKDVSYFLRLVDDIMWMADASKYERFSSFFKVISSVQKYVKEAEEVASEVLKERARRAAHGAPDLVLKLNNSDTFSSNLGSGVRVLYEIDYVGLKRQLIGGPVGTSAADVLESSPHQIFRKLWGNRRHETMIGEMFSQIDQLIAYCASIRGKSVFEMREVFNEATKVQGIPVTKGALQEAIRALQNAGEFAAAQKFIEIFELPELDFASKKAALTGAATTLTALQRVFDDFFGNGPNTTVQKVVRVSQHHHHSGPSVVIVVVICVGVFILLVVSCVVGYGFTRNGKRKYKNLYLFYFGKPEEYEKRWRYSMFLDRTEGANSLTDATRELNQENVLKALRKGAYINVYSKYGNTPLHSAAKLGHAQLVAILIKHGADRSLLNAQNKTAEQLIPKNLSKAQNAEKYAETVAVFEKYRNKKFRVRVPDEFPISSFHIYIEDRTDDGVTSEFMLKFRSITSEEALVTTTHCVVKTEEGDVLATDSLNLLFWIFHGVIMVKDTWMVECLKDEKEIAHDYKYLVEKVKYKGVVYENVVTPWTQAKAKGTMPFLYGVFAVVVMDYYPNLELVSSLIVTNGGTMLDAFPDKSQFNQGSHPYLHAHLGPLFVLHDGKTPVLLELKKDPMFTLFTEEEFLVFMLKREINIDKSKNPIHAVDSDH